MMFGEELVQLEPPEVYAEQIESVLHASVAAHEVIELYGKFYQSWEESKSGVVLIDPRTEGLAKLGLKVSTLIIDANDSGKIVPPLNREQKDRFVRRYVANTSLIERHLRAVRFPDKQFGPQSRFRAQR